ncbi:MAG: AsmA family protein [Salinarimonas sp.]|nr:AsmA family protein [Salinarimonas sp.]
MKRFSVKRIVVLLIAVLAIGGVVLALAPWTVSSRALTADVSEQLREEFGIELDVAGRTVIAFLPLPRLKFEDVTLTSRDGTPLARGGELRGQLAVRPLLFGRIALDEISLSNSRLDVSIDEHGEGPWSPLVADARQRLDSGAGPLAISRISVNNVQIFYDDARDGTRQVLRNVDMALYWPRAQGPVTLNGSLRIRGETLDIALSDLRPAALLADETSPMDLRLSTRFGRLLVAGTVSRGIDSPWLSGRASFETRAMRDLLVWSGQELPLGPLLGALSLEGEVSGVGRVVSWPSVRVTMGGDRLEGALTARLEGERLAINGTLAADTLRLDDFAAPFLDAAMPSGPWRFQRYDLSQTSAADLDLRVSASEARLRGLRMSDVAMSVLVKEGRIETALSRAMIHGGTARGRLALTRLAEGDGVELRAQGSVEAMDLGATFRETGGTTWVTGRADGEFNLQARGHHAFDMARRAVGEGRVKVRNGQFVGIALDDAIRRFEHQPLTASRNLRSGMTAFDEAHAGIRVENGLGKVVDAGFAAPSISGVVQGIFFIPDRRISARAAVQSKEAVADGDMVSALSFDIQGPWHDIAILPDANALIQRSGAARLLLGPTVEAVPLDELPAQ